MQEQKPSDIYSVAPLPNGEHPSAASLRRERKLAARLGRLAALAVTLLLVAPLAEQSDGGSQGVFLFVSNAVSNWSSSPWIQALLYSAILAVLYGVVNFPFGFWSGHVLERRYGLSTQTARQWLWDQTKAALVGMVLGAIVVLGVVAALLWTGRAWWAVTALGAAIFGVILTRLAPQLIIPLFYRMKPIDAPELQARFKALGEKTRTPVLGIYEIDFSRRTRTANAAVVGFGRSRRAIVGDTLLENFKTEEIEFVLAHELAHHRYHDLWVGIATGTAVVLLSLWGTDRALLLIGPRLNVAYPVYEAGFAPAVLFLIGLGSGVAEAVLSPLSRLLSRFAETRADRFAARATGNPGAGASAFRRLGYRNLAVFRPPRWEEALFFTHPCIGRRIRRLEQGPL